MKAARDAKWDDYMAEAMKDPAEAAAYLDAVLEMEDQAALLVALRHVAKAHGMAEISRSAGLGEKTLFRALSEQGNPTIETLNKVLHAVGLRLSVEPLTA
jgi:probable addiction module antidote protein